MPKITLLLWKDFDQNFMLAEGLLSIPCLHAPPVKISIDMEFLYLVGLGGKSFSCQTKEQLWLSLYCG